MQWKGQNEMQMRTDHSIINYANATIAGHNGQWRVERKSFVLLCMARNQLSPLLDREMSAGESCTFSLGQSLSVRITRSGVHLNWRHTKHVPIACSTAITGALIPNCCARLTVAVIVTEPFFTASAAAALHVPRYRIAGLMLC